MNIKVVCHDGSIDEYLRVFTTEADAKKYIDTHAKQHGRLEAQYFMVNTIEGPTPKSAQIVVDSIDSNVDIRKSLIFKDRVRRLFDDYPSITQWPGRDAALDEVSKPDASRCTDNAIAGWLLSERILNHPTFVDDELWATKDIKIVIIHARVI